jgi:NADH-quinone oxidoreductase subunit J
VVGETTAFVVFAAIAVVGAVNVVVRRNPVHGALWLAGAFLGVAGVFLTLQSPLLAAIQVIVYAGAIMVLFLFVILLLNLETPPFEGISCARGASSLAALAVLALLLHPFVTDESLRVVGKPLDPSRLPATAANVGSLLFTKWAMPFEVVSLLLLVAMVGAIHLARRVRRDEPV